MNITNIIKGPVITEKSHQLIGDKNAYTLKVAGQANKFTVKNAVVELYDVTVLSVNILNKPPKIKNVGKKRRPVSIAGFKKAIVILKEGDKIPLFEIEKGKK